MQVCGLTVLPLFMISLQEYNTLFKLINSCNLTQQLNQKTSDTSIPTTCKSINDILPDPKCTPGTTDHTVTQANIDSTICISGYTKH